jgi:ubiquinone/menaquinone biosynthesis C-methylase UbiE
MGIYQKWILPKVVNAACSQKPTRKQREKVVPLASGQVLEIGIGSGLNFPHYDTQKVKNIWGLEPSAEMRCMAETMAAGSELDVSFIEASAEDIPLDDNSVDTVLVTYSLCTIPAAVTALAEMHRVLRPEGQLIFCEHGHAPDENVQRWQRRLNPVWKRFGGGCNLNRHIPDLLRQGGFKIQMLESDYIPGWKPASFNYWGTAIHQ